MGVAILEDEELVSRIKAGDTQSLDILVEVYFPKTYRKVRRLVPIEDAEDVTQDIFLNLVCSIDNFQGRSAFATWFNRIVANRVADYHRRMFRQKDEIARGEGMTRCELSQEADDNLEMEELMMSLPERYREVTSKRLYYNLSFAEIASDLAIT